jgi:hypothetical protein
MDIKTLGWPVIREIMTLARPRVTHADMIQGIISLFILQLLFSLDCLFVKLLLILP